MSKIFEQLKNVDMQQRVTIIRENILSLYGGEIGDNCLAIYLFAYCVNRYSDKTFLEALKKFYEEAEIIKNTNQINTIINIGRADGIFLKILDNKGRIKQQRKVRLIYKVKGINEEIALKYLKRIY